MPDERQRRALSAVEELVDELHCERRKQRGDAGACQPRLTRPGLGQPGPKALELRSQSKEAHSRDVIPATLAAKPSCRLAALESRERWRSEL